MITTLNDRLKDVYAEEEEMKTELYSKYDEIHRLEEKEKRVQQQYLEAARQLRAIESEALNKTYPTQPPPPPQSIVPPETTELIRELRSQIKLLEEKHKSQRTLLDSKQLLNVKLTAKNEELLTERDRFKRELEREREDRLKEKERWRDREKEYQEYRERFLGPNNELMAKLEELEQALESEKKKYDDFVKSSEEKDEKHRIQLSDKEHEVAYMRNVLKEYETQIEALEEMIEEESSEMTQSLIEMKKDSEGLYRFLQAVIRHHEQNLAAVQLSKRENDSCYEDEGEDLIGEREASLSLSPRSHPEEKIEEKTPSLSLSAVSSSPVMDLQDLIYLLDAGIMTLKMKPGNRPLHQHLSSLSSYQKPSLSSSHSLALTQSSRRPPPLSAGGKLGLECLGRLLDHLDKFQLNELQRHFKTIPSIVEKDEVQSISSQHSHQSIDGQKPMKLGKNALLPP
jgi:hypothetical protein